MLTFGFSRRIFLRRGATDMRKSFDSLAGLVRLEFAANPLSGDAFVFVGKAVNRVKILVFDRSGFWVLSKVSVHPPTRRSPPLRSLFA